MFVHPVPNLTTTPAEDEQDTAPAREAYKTRHGDALASLKSRIDSYNGSLSLDTPPEGLRALRAWFDAMATTPVGKATGHNVEFFAMYARAALGKPEADLPDLSCPTGDLLTESVWSWVVSLLGSYKSEALDSFAADFNLKRG